MQSIYDPDIARIKKLLFDLKNKLRIVQRAKKEEHNNKKRLFYGETPIKREARLRSNKYQRERYANNPEYRKQDIIKHQKVNNNKRNAWLSQSEEEKARVMEEARKEIMKGLRWLKKLGIKNTNNYLKTWMN